MAFSVEGLEDSRLRLRRCESHLVVPTDDINLHTKPAQHVEAARLLAVITADIVSSILGVAKGISLRK